MRRIAALTLGMFLLIAAFPGAASAVPTWTVLSAPTAPPGAASTSLGALSCTTRTACTAVGSYTTVSGGQFTLAERWNGTSWILQSTLNGNKNSVFYGISCPSLTTCFAVGNYSNNAGTNLPLLERWNGTSWSNPPFPRFWKGARFNGISCTNPNACTIVGYMPLSQSVTQAMRWNGTSWTFQTTVTPPNAKDYLLRAVSCPTTTACTAVGTFTDQSNKTNALVEHWNGAGWVIQTTPNTPGDNFNLKVVSCPTATFCVTAGNGIVKGGGGGEMWNGTTWTHASGFYVQGSRGGEFTGASCATPAACTTVGAYFDSSYGLHPWASRWSGGPTWSAQTPPPTGAAGPYLNAVSCPDASTCIAVGNDAGVVFAERYTQ